MDRNSKLLKDTVILAIGQFFPKLIALITIPILTAHMTERDYGIYELSISVASFCIPLLSVQIQQAAFRYLIEPKVQKEKIISNSLFFIVLSFLFFGIPIVVGWKLFVADTSLGIIFFGSYFAEALLNWASQVTRGMGDNITYSIAYIVYSIVFLIGIVLSYILLEGIPVKAVGISIMLSYAISFLFLVLKKKLFQYISFSELGKNNIKFLLSYSAPMVISSVALWTVNLSDRFFVTGFLGIEVTALYGVANKIPNLFNSVYGIFNLAWTENTSRLSQKEKDEGYYTDFFNQFFNVMTGMLSCLICVSPLLYKILVKNYPEAYRLMSWLYVGVFFSSLVAFFGSIYVGEKKTKNVGISSAIGAVINVLVNLLFMKKFGVIVASISTIISYFIIGCYRAYDILKYVKIEYDYKMIIKGFLVIIILAVINYKFSIVITAISLVITIGFNVLYNQLFFIRLIGRIKQIIARK